MPFVERDHERFNFVIENDKKSIADEQRRNALAKRESHLHLHAQIFFAG